MSIQDVDFVAWDNCDPPQLWAWSGEYGDESAEPLFRLPADGLRAEFDAKDAEIERLRVAGDGLVNSVKRLSIALFGIEGKWRDAKADWWQDLVKKVDEWEAVR